MQTSILIFGIIASAALSLAVNADTPAAPNATVEAREILVGKKSQLSITTYAGAECSGPLSEYNNIEYGYNYEGDIRSYSLNRDLGENEQLDFSQFSTAWHVNNPACGKFYVSASPQAKAGHCFHHQKVATCFRFWVHG